MIWVVVALQVIVLGVLWDVRRTLGCRVRFRRPRPAATRAPAPTTPRSFPGAIPPNRYVVVRWPQGRLEYQGCIGSAARTVYEHTHPAAGEEIEFWELGDRRGHKEG